MVKTSQENKGTDSLLGSGEGVAGDHLLQRRGDVGLLFLPPPAPALEDSGEEKVSPWIKKRASPKPTPSAWDKGCTRALARCHKGPPATRPPLTSWGGCPALELTSSGLLLMAELREAPRSSCPVQLGN